MLGIWSLVLGIWSLGYPVLQTGHVTLIPHVPAHLLALGKSEQEYEQVSGFKAAPGIREYRLMASPEFFRSLENATEPDPWKFGFAIVHTADDLVIGLCGFTGPPDSTGCVELGYSIAPAYQGQGLATETAQALIEFAKSERAQKVCAHTLAEINASTRVLEKCGLEKTAETTEPDGTLVWRWEKPLMTKPPAFAGLRRAGE